MGFRVGLMRGWLSLLGVMGLLLTFAHCSTPDCYYDVADPNGKGGCKEGQVCKEGKCVDVTFATCTKNEDCKGENEQCFSGRCVLLPKGYEFPPPAEPRPEPVQETKDGGGEQTKETPPDGGGEQTKESGPEGGERDPDSPTKKGCLSTADCQANEVCAADDSGKLHCEADNKRGTALGEQCDPNDTQLPGPCRSRMCHPDKYCTTPCKADQDCPGGAQGACVETDFGKRGKHKVCQIKDSRCSRDNECGEGQFCVFDQIGNGAGSKCGLLKGGGELGDRCVDHSECKYNVCIDRTTCGQSCAADSDCKKPFTCQSIEVEFPQGSSNKYTFRTCQVPPEGLACKVNKDCVRQGYVCSPKDHKGKLELRCQKPLGTKDFNEACKADNECRSNYCLDSGVCSQACETAQTCPTVPNVTVECQDVSLKRGALTGKLKACLPLRKGCVADDDCQKDEVCAPYTNDAGGYAFRCVKRFTGFGNTPNGNACTQNSDCQSLYCKGQKCEDCTGDSDCGAGNICHEKACVKAKRLGADCGADSDCLGRVCFNKVCSQSCKNNDGCKNKAGFGCTSEKLTNPSGTDVTAQICTVPQGGLPCFTNSDCPSAQQDQCRIVEVGGTMVTRCRAKAGTKALGATCSADADCISGSCLMPDGICTQSCAKDTDCSGKDTFCLQREFKPSGGGAGAQIKVCATRICDGDAGCSRNRLCVYQTVNSVGFLRCRAPDSAKKKIGDTCSADGDCQTGLCRKGTTTNVCASACKGGSSAHCPLQTACEGTATGTGSTHLCIPLQGACKLDKDCQSGEQCVLSTDASGRPNRICGKAVGKDDDGAACDPKATTSTCKSGFCDPLTSKCASFCTKDSDCSGSDVKCSLASLPKKQGQVGPSWQFNYCRSTLCSHNGACLSSELCSVSIVNQKPVKKCIAPNGKKPGEACTSNNDCSSLVCFRSACVNLCEAHRHCAASENCQATQLLPGIQTSICATGTRASCDGTADCATGEVCQANINTQGQVSRQCKTPKSNEKAAGSVCTPGTFPGDCASHVCDTVTKKCLKLCKPGLNDCLIGSETCRPFPLVGKSVNVCLPPPQPCKKQTDCPTDTHCSVTINSSTQKAEFFCARPNSSGTLFKKLGDTCDPNLPLPGECQTGLCHPLLKVCVGTCEDDADCPTARPRCGKAELAGGVLAPACIPDKAACQYSGTCPSSQPVCALEINGNQLSSRCGAGGPGTKKVDESCDPSKNIPGDCVTRFCEAGRRICAATCAKDSHCPQGLKCLTTFVEGNRSVKGCMVPPGTTCTKALDCSSPTVCRATRETNGVVGKCGPFSGGTNIGGDCNPQEVTQGSKNYKLLNDCQSRICHPKSLRCSSLCNQDSDCITGRCEQETYEGFQIKVCNALCSSDGQCPVTGQICGVSFEKSGTTTLTPQCIVPQANLAKKGAACDPTKALYAECQSGFCSPGTSTCVALCAKDADCVTGEVCATTFIPTGSGQYLPATACMPSTGACTKPAHCLKNHVCIAEDRSGKAVLNCVLNPQGAASNATCDPQKSFPGDCQSRLCDPKSKTCSTPCTADADCNIGTTRTKCGTITVQGTAIQACVEP